MARKRQSPGSDDIQQEREQLNSLASHPMISKQVDEPPGENEMALDPTVQAVYEGQNLTDNKAMAVDGPILRIQEGHDKTLRQVDVNFERLASEQQSLFAQTLQQRDALFAQAMRHAEDNHQVVIRMAQDQATISVKTLDKDTNEVNSEAVGAEVVAGLAPEIRQAIDAAVAKNVNTTQVSSDAIAAAVAAAVVAALAKA